MCWNTAHVLNDVSNSVLVAKVLRIITKLRITLKRMTESEPKQLTQKTMECRDEDISVYLHRIQKMYGHGVWVSHMIFS